MKEDNSSKKKIKFIFYLVLVKKNKYYLYTFGCVLLLYFIATKTITEDRVL